MNRPIKFRAWDKEFEKMTISYTLDELFANACPLHEAVKDYYVWMQFTGLYDKNGKEIYEGDIVESRYISIGAGEIVSLNTVEWNAPCFYLGGKHMGYNPNGVIAKAWQMDQTVIGNIYETPDMPI